MDASDMRASEGLPLEGVRVIDFSRLLPGPWCTQVLGDMGADVIKVEQPGVGDYSRFNPPCLGASGVYFNGVNRSKRSIALDLELTEDRETVLALLAEADIVVETFRPGVAARLGISYEAVRALNSGVVYCSITGFARGGPLEGLPGHDLSLQGMSGLMHRGLAPGEVPSNPRLQGADFAAASYAAIAVLAALMHRQRTGRGRYIEVPLYDSMLNWSLVGLTGALARLAGFAGTPELEYTGGNPRYRAYATRDGKAVTVSLLETRTWNRFCRLIGRDDLIFPHEQWSDRHGDHGERSQAIADAISQLCLAHDRDSLAQWMMGEGIPICPVYTPDEALAAAEAQRRGLVRLIDHPREGRVPVLIDPLARAGLADPSRALAPAIDEQGEAIRAELRAAARAAPRETA